MSVAPPPTGTSSPPPEGAHDVEECQILSLAPSIEMTNNVPVPYGIVAHASDDACYSPNVRYRGYRAMRLDSFVTKNEGDEPANGTKGIVSTASQGIATPITSSTIVRINGSPAIRHGDVFQMDQATPEGPGNTIGECQLVRDVAPRPAPSWWERVKDTARGAAASVVGAVADGMDAVGEFDENHWHVLTRAVGVVGVIGDTAEAVTEGAAAVVTSETVVGAVGFGAASAYSADNAWASARTVWYGEAQDTYLQQGAEGAVKDMGGSDRAAKAAALAVGLAPVLNPKTILKGAKALSGGVRELANSLKAERAAADELEEAERIAKAEREAAKSGKPGVRVTGKKINLRRPYIRKWVRDEVEKRAKRTADGRPIDPNTGKPIDGKPDLGHKLGHEFWREKERAEGQGLTQEQFNDRMNDPDLYQLEDPSSNRSHEYEQPR